MKKFNKLSEAQQQVAKDLGYHGMYSDRATLAEAGNYMMSIINPMREDMKMGVITGVQVLINTYALHAANSKATRSQLEDFAEECDDYGMVMEAIDRYLGNTREED